MKHWAVINRKSGAHHFVITGDDQDPSECGVPKRGNRFVALDREPSEHDRFDGNCLVHCEKTKARRDDETMLNRMSRAQFRDHIRNMVREMMNA